MARLIDADELKSKLQGHKDYFVDGWGGFDKMSFATKCRVDEIDNCIAEIVNAPTIDAVPVVRCKDCKYGMYAGLGKFMCELHEFVGKAYFYCADGERRTDG